MGDFLTMVFAVVLGNFLFHTIIAKLNEALERYSQYGDDNWS